MPCLQWVSPSEGPQAYRPESAVTWSSDLWTWPTTASRGGQSNVQPLVRHIVCRSMHGQTMTRVAMEASTPFSCNSTTTLHGVHYAPGPRREPRRQPPAGSSLRSIRGPPRVRRQSWSDLWTRPTTASRGRQSNVQPLGLHSVCRSTHGPSMTRVALEASTNLCMGSTMILVRRASTQWRKRRREVHYIPASNTQQPPKVSPKHATVTEQCPA